MYVLNQFSEVIVDFKTHPLATVIYSLFLKDINKNSQYLNIGFSIDVGLNGLYDLISDRFVQ